MIFIPGGESFDSIWREKEVRSRHFTAMQIKAEFIFN